MKKIFTIEKKGENYLVINTINGSNRGVFKRKSEAEVQMNKLQKTHDDGKEMVKGSTKKDMQEEKDDKGNDNKDEENDM